LIDLAFFNGTNVQIWYTINAVDRGNLNIFNPIQKLIFFILAFLRPALKRIR